MQPMHGGLGGILMKLAVSNIAWDNAELAEHLALLRDLGCQGIELAPSCIWPEPVDASAGERAGLKEMVRKSGLELTGFHALLFTRPDLQLFKDRNGRDLTVDYVVGLARLCSDLDGRLLVFGSPRNRARHGRDYRECLAWAAEAFGAAAAQCEPLGVTICILNSGGVPFVPDPTGGLKTAGSGRGLANVKNRSLAIGARCTWEATDCGSRFSLWLPLLRMP